MRMLSCSGGDSMKRATILLTFIVLALAAGPASAALYDLSHYGYSEAYIYDTDTSLMWLSNANANDLMTQAGASTWAGSLTNEGGGWRLPFADPSGLNEFDSLFAGLTEISRTPMLASFEYTFTYDTTPVTAMIDVNIDQPYWSGTNVNPVFVRTFNFDDGATNMSFKSNSRYAWAVRYDPDVNLTHTPVPASLWLMASGIFCLLGYRRVNAK